jgi:hypothetical protein
MHFTPHVRLLENNQCGQVDSQKTQGAWTACIKKHSVVGEFVVFCRSRVSVNPWRTKGLNVQSIYTISTKPHLLLKWFMFMGLKLILVLCYVKEKIKICLEVMLMIETLSMYLHPRAPVVWIWTQIFNRIKVFKWFDGVYLDNVTFVKEFGWIENLSLNNVVTKNQLVLCRQQHTRYRWSTI